MSLTIAVVPNTRESGPQLIHELYDITFDSSYASGGEAVQATDFGLRALLGLEVVGGNAAAALYHFFFDTTNLKILAAISAGLTPAGTVAAPTFTGSALGNHTHNLSLKNAAVADGATTRVNAGANLLGANTGADLTITGAGANGGVANASAGTPAGTNSAPAFTGAAVAAAAFVEASGDLSTLTIRARVYGK